jgi:2-desacetyl-2-hydroxyethyl bacteriochlorophyllide A dehydrogenase
MRQIVLRGPGDFVEKEVPRPALSPGEAVLRIRKVGVCGSDFHAFAGRHPVYTYPRVLGHELAGEVVEVFPNDHKIFIGDRCAIEPYISCGKCRPCSLGRSNCCDHLRLFGVHVDGGMQNFLAVPLSLLHKSKLLSFEQLALIETLGIGAHAVSRSELRPGETALVIGAGPIGLAVAQFAKAAGADVRVVERNEWRKKFAALREISTASEPDGNVADVVFDATGSANSMSASLSWVAPAGRLVFVGLTKEVINIDDALLHKREVTLYASRNSCGQFPRIIRMIEEQNIDTSPWITDRMALIDVPTRFKNLPGKATLIKAIIDVEDTEL